MELLIVLFIFFIGLFFGSFLNVVIDRVPRGENFFIGRSHCDFCKHPLAWYDLFPLFSFLLLKGKCRYCKKFIGWKYPLIEITTASLFSLIVWQTFGFSLLAESALLLIGSLLIVIFYIDLYSGIIPDVVLISLLCIGIARLFFLRIPPLFPLLSSLGAGAFFLFIFFITKKRGMGFGDVKYAFVMGLLLGFPGIIIGLYIAFLTGAFVALILIIGRKKSFASAIAFGPFLVLGTIVTLIWGTPLWEIFRHIIGI